MYEKREVQGLLWFLIPLAFQAFACLKLHGLCPHLFPAFHFPAPTSLNAFHSLCLAQTSPFYQRTFTPEASSHILAVKEQLKSKSF